MELKSYQKEALRALEDFLHRVGAYEKDLPNFLDQAFREVAARYM